MLCLLLGRPRIHLHSTMMRARLLKSRRKVVIQHEADLAYFVRREGLGAAQALTLQSRMAHSGPSGTLFGTESSVIKVNWRPSFPNNSPHRTLCWRHNAVKEVSAVIPHGRPSERKGQPSLPSSTA